MERDQKRARVFGVLYLITFVTGILGLVLYETILRHPRSYIAGAGHDKQVLFGALLELLLIVANIGTAVVIFPIVRRLNEELALGYVTARIVECGFIAVGIVSVLAIMALRQDPAGTSDGTLVALGQSLVDIHDATFLLGPGFVVGVGNGLILGFLMYRSGLVPRRMAWFGLIGGPLVCLSGIAVMFGAFDAGSAPQGLATIPEIIWEAFLGIYLTFKGFRVTADVREESRDGGVDPGLAVAAP